MAEPVQYYRDGGPALREGGSRQDGDQGSGGGRLLHRRRFHRSADPDAAGRAGGYAEYQLRQGNGESERRDQYADRNAGVHAV